MRMSVTEIKEKEGEKVKLRLYKKLHELSKNISDKSGMLFTIEFWTTKTIDVDIYSEMLEIADHCEALTDTEDIIIQRIDPDEYKEVIKLIEEEFPKSAEKSKKALKILKEWKESGFYLAVRVTR